MRDGRETKSSCESLEELSLRVVSTFNRNLDAIKIHEKEIAEVEK